MKRFQNLSKLPSALLAFILCFGMLPYLSRTDVYAADFDIEVTRTYTVSPDGSSMHITEERLVSSNSTKFYIPTTSSETFSIQDFKQGITDNELEQKKSSISVTNGNQTKLPYTTTVNGNDIEVNVPYPTSVTTGNSATFILEYETTELIETVGSITNIYIPGLSKTYEETSTDPLLMSTRRGRSARSSSLPIRSHPSSTSNTPG